MSKHDSQIGAGKGEPLGLDELVAALGRAPLSVAERSDAMAHYLSGEDGWKDARRSLRGAFAKSSPNGTGLTTGKDT